MDILAIEREHLAGTIKIARQQLDMALESEMEAQARLTESRRELHEQAQAFASLYSSDAFENLLNLNQYQDPVTAGEKLREMGRERVDVLRLMLDTPYFARIDLDFGDGCDVELIYIGRATLRDDATHEIFVHDWRSPVASVFYKFGLGEAYYDAPGGRINCKVLLKRQYEIKHGRLEYYFDADVGVQDEFLRAMLARNSSPVMRSIVETIQRDQDAAIRDTEHELLMVQGVAGSGKTAIALHRAAYLMYHELNARLSADEILILSPNALFERYIQGVLPELGERNVATRTFDELISGLIGGVQVETRGDRFERLLVEGAELERDAEAFKASPEFKAVIERFVRSLPRAVVPFTDIYYGGELIARREALRARAIRDERTLPLGARLGQMERSLWDGISERRAARLDALLDCARGYQRHQLELAECARAYSILECELLGRQIRAFTRLDCSALYDHLMTDELAFRRLGRGLVLPDNLGAILSRTRASLGGATLELTDAVGIAYLGLLVNGSPRNVPTRQVLVDEAQDYDRMQFALLGGLFQRARFTVLGDINQSLERDVGMELYEDIASGLNRRSAHLVELKKSFRCTREILDYSLKLIGRAGEVESFNRGGEPPFEYCATDMAELAQLVAIEVSACRAAGYGSIALIARTQSDARRMYKMLSFIDGLELAGAEFGLTGTFVVPLQLAKGLEFDAALVLDAGRFEPRQQYVACTRALHRLSVFMLKEDAEYAD